MSLDFHLKSIKEMLRVACEVRIFPLEDFSGSISPYVENLKKEFQDNGNTVSIEIVDYKIKIFGNKMLRIVQK